MRVFQVLEFFESLAPTVTKSNEKLEILTFPTLLAKASFFGKNASIKIPGGSYGRF